MNILKLKTMALVIALGATSSVFAGLVNINKADGEALAHHLKGVGSKKAEAIILYRGEHGPFADINDLVNVKGIGEGTLKKNLEDISLSQGAVTLAKTEDSLKKADDKLKKPVVISKKKLSKDADVSKSSKKRQVVAKTDTKEIVSGKKISSTKALEKAEK